MLVSETEAITEPQTLESVIVHNSNSIFPVPHLMLQTTESINIEPSTSIHPNQFQTINNNEFIIYSRKKKKSKEDIEQRTHSGLVHETEHSSVPK